MDEKKLAKVFITDDFLSSLKVDIDKADAAGKFTPDLAFQAVATIIVDEEGNPVVVAQEVRVGTVDNKKEESNEVRVPETSPTPEDDRGRGI